MAAYIGSLFPAIKKWKYVKYERGKYPYQSAVDLLQQGLIPTFDGSKWRLHAGLKALPVLEISKEELMEETKRQ
jgi:protein-tyrosine phosphatase